MTVSTFIHRRLVDLLEEQRVVVWYDAEQSFTELSAKLTMPNCIFVDATDSILKSRREADRVLAGINDPDNSELKHKHLLVYCPRSRGKREEEKYEDPFEVFAVFGAAFGDDEGDKLQSLARQAMPDRSGEIDRLFDEGQPTLTMLDNLKVGQSFPLIKDCLGTDSPIDVVAKVLCEKDVVAKIEETPGVIDELLRMLHDEFGYSPPPRKAKAEAKLAPLGAYVLLSEFVFDLQTSVPDGLSDLTVADPAHRDRIFAVCDRMRRNDDFREGYIGLAQRMESELKLRDSFQDCNQLGVRDTFPFEEQRFLKRLPELVNSGDLDAASEIVNTRRGSVWSSLGERALLWKVAERCVEFMRIAAACAKKIPESTLSPKQHVENYVHHDGGLWLIDQHQRLVEHGSAGCAEDDEIEQLVELCRKEYFEIAGKAQDSFLQAVARDGWPPDTISHHTQTFDKHVTPLLAEGARVAYFLVDSIRYEMGHDLGASLEEHGNVRVESSVSILPTVTPFGMSALMPGAESAWKIIEKKNDLLPALGDSAMPGVAERKSLLKSRFGDRFADATLESVLTIKEKRPPKQIANADLVVVRTQEMDAFGEVMPLYQARKHMSGILGELVTATNRLSKLGYTHFVYVADHGHVLLPEIAAGDAIKKPPGEWKLEKRRCLLGHSTGPASGVTIIKTEKLGIDVPVPEMAVASGFRVFKAGAGYFHEGMSLQECVLPIVILTSTKAKAETSSSTDIQIRYRSDSFTSPIIGLKLLHNSLFGEPLLIRLEAYDGNGTKANSVGEAADCDARDPNTGLITLAKGETQVPLRVDADFEGKQIEVRAIAADGPGVVLARKILKNKMMM
ncbi:MAG: PglZ domain-containing protein [Planctomycetota bacterium]